MVKAEMLLTHSFVEEFILVESTENFQAMAEKLSN